MIYAVKYQLSFYDLNGAQCVVFFSVAGYTGEILPIVAGENAVSINRQGDNINPFDPIRTSSATIDIKVDDNCLLLISDLQDIDDTTMSCTITSGGASFNGFVVPDQTARTFSEITGDITITAKDIFSILQGTTTYNSDGTIIFGKQTLSDYIKAQFNAGTNGAFDLTFNIVAPYTLDLTAPELMGLNLLEQIQARAEGFNTTDGLPDTCYNIIKKILASIGAYSFIEGTQVNIICFAGRISDGYPTNVFIKNQTNTSNFLVNNSEQITYIRGAKEVSADLNFSSNNGLLLNAFFKGWDSLNTYPLEWPLLPPGFATVTKISGNNRIEGNSGVKIQSVYNSTTDFGITAPNAISQTIHVYKGFAYKLTFVVIGHDYSQWDTTTGKVGSQTEPPAISPFVNLVSSASGFNSNLYNPAGGIRWTKGDGTDPSGGQVYLQLSNSTQAQTLSVDIPPCPFEGDMQIMLGGVALSMSVYGINSSTMDRTSVIYKSVILDSANTNNGETDYLTQSKNYSLKNAKADTYLDCGIPDNVAGALYNAVAFTQSGTGTTIAAGSLMPYAGIYRNGETNALSLMHQLVRSFMSFYRSARGHISFEVYSNTIKFGDLIVFDNALMPNKYMQLTNEYDIRNNIQKIVAVEVNPEFLADQTTALPTDTQDLYEHYNVVI